MIPIHFNAQYEPHLQEFAVTVKFGDKELSENMSVPKFIGFARDSKEPMVIGGVSVYFDGDDDGAILNQVWGYFRSVADSYTETQWETPTNIQSN